MRFLLTALVFAGFLTANIATALEKSAALEVRRLDQRINRLQDTNNRLVQEIRTLQRENEEMKRTVLKSETDVVRLDDSLLKFQNVDMSNYRSKQKQIYDDLKASHMQLREELESDRRDMNNRMTDLDWGSQERECEGIGKHQQIKHIESPDGDFTLKYLCHDGRLLHLGTQLNTPPK